MRTWNTVAIVGVGLMGGSIGLALRERKLARRIVGIGRRQASLDQALARGCVTEITTSVIEGVREAELIVVCSPVQSIARQMAEVCRHCSDTCVITDVGSTKEAVVIETQAELA